MIIIFDLDYTLLDAKKLKQGLAKALGLTAREFEKSYLEHFKNKKINYNFEKHLQILDKKHTPQIDKFFKNLDQYLFPQSLNILKKLKTNNKLILLSFGNKNWQKQKINNLNIKKYFDKIILTDKSKAEILKQLQGTKDKILIINDNARETLEMQKTLKNAKVFLVKGVYANNCEHDLEVKNLAELNNIEF